MGATDLGFTRRRQAKDATDVGGMIADRYQIEELSREDASTSTLLAKHLALEERVAVQVLRPERRFDKQLAVQYLAAVKSLAPIKTDHVVRVLDVGVALYLGPFMVMEHLEGSTLQQVLRAEGRLPVPRAVDYVLQACKGLAVAHAAGVVHRQLHTGRLLLARRGEFETLKVIDFPTLDIALTEPVSADESGSRRGYLAPEVLSGDAAVDRRADVWSLGAILYELVTGRSALTPTDLDALAQDHAALSPALRQIIARCMQPEPAQRFTDVDELAAELLPLTSLNEVFRGSLTGSFSRQMILAAAAQARAAVSEKRAVPPARIAPWRARLLSFRTGLPGLHWQERWQDLQHTWDERVAPGGPPLRQAFAVAAMALLIGWGGIEWGKVSLTPAPSRWRASSVPSGLLPAAVPVLPVLPVDHPPAEVLPAEVLPAEPARVDTEEATELRPAVPKKHAAQVRRKSGRKLRRSK